MKALARAIFRWLFYVADTYRIVTYHPDEPLSFIDIYGWRYLWVIITFIILLTFESWTKQSD